MKLGEALRAAAQDAGMYADAERALQTARRRRRRRLVAEAAGVAALVIAAVWAAQLLPFRAGGPPASPRPTATSASAAAYPARVEPPAGTAAALPADRGVGPAAFIYSIGDRPLLVTTTGAQYALPTPDLFNVGLVALSPDGRWLLDGSVLRDLTSTTTHDVPSGTAQWSPNGRWLLIGTSSRYHLADTATGRVTDVADAVGVLDTGQMLVAGNVQGTRATITLTGANGGGRARTFTVDASSVLRADEAIGVRNGENGYFLSRVWPYSTDRALFEVQGSTNLVVLLDVSLTDGRVLHRIAIPAEQPPLRFWAIAGMDSGRLVLLHEPPATASPGPGSATPVPPYQLGVIDPSGGTPAVVCTIPAHSLVLARGAHVTL